MAQYLRSWLWFFDFKMLCAIVLFNLFAAGITLAGVGMLTLVDDPDAALARRETTLATDFSYGVELRGVTERSIGVELRKIGEDEQLIVYDRFVWR